MFNTFRDLYQPLREALLLLFASTVLGLSYSALTEKGLFSSEPKKPSVMTPAMEHPPAFISFEEAVAFYETGKALFVDGRHEYDFKLGHIKGAINLPLKEFATGRTVLTRYPMDQLLITYCDGVECNSSIDLAMKLDSLGYSNVKIFFGGWQEWQSHAKPVE